MKLHVTTPMETIIGKQCLGRKFVESFAIHKRYYGANNTNCHQNLIKIRYQKSM